MKKLNLAPYTFYIRLAAVKAQEALSGKTLLLPDGPGVSYKHEVIESTRKLAKARLQSDSNSLNNDNVKKGKVTGKKQKRGIPGSKRKSN
ncbi:hypothetical protein EON76_04575 [bacterium]|nr:MAG: hypothetical protein EON76_04575 [bacterium]